MPAAAAAAASAPQVSLNAAEATTNPEVAAAHGSGSSSAHEWCQLLLGDMAVAQLLGVLLHLVPAIKSGVFGGDSSAQLYNSHVTQQQLAPLAGAAATVAAEAEVEPQRGVEGFSGATVGGCNKGVRAVVTEGKQPPAGLAWEPELLRMLVPELLSYCGQEDELAAAMEVLAGQLEVWAGGEGGWGDGVEGRLMAQLPPVFNGVWAASKGCF
ncbi:hypothetical protein PLESTF_000403000 [Pleodorina starrii]|nr:hypothetical protein PLESTF_000403000 [Pleodorina starrii]